MKVHDLLIDDHLHIRRRAEECTRLSVTGGEKLAAALKDFQTAVQRHFRREEPYYRLLDDGKRVEDRELMHHLRNDHAASIFTLESLAIRLRKNGANDDWRQRLKNLLDVLLPHMDKEEATLFPIAEKFLSAAELDHLYNEIKANE